MNQPTTSPADRTVSIIDSSLADFFAQRTREAAMISPSYLRLWKDMYTLVQAGGKRLRPKMLFMSYRAFGGDDLDRIAPVAAATELLHLSMLIHDDIIDRDLVRYGVDNMTAMYLRHYADCVDDEGDRRHFAESAALLAGDLLLSGSHQLIATADLDTELRERVHVIFSRSVFEVASGELLDTEAAFTNPEDVNPLVIARYKTAGYSFISPLLIGATLAGASVNQLEAVRQFGEQLGIGFQIQDDILGIYGLSGKLGKSTTGDIREGKRTYLIECFQELANEEQRSIFNDIFGKPEISDEEAATFRELLVASGARSRAELKLTELEAKAIAALAAMELSSGYHEEFMQLVNKSLRRSY